MKVGELKRLLLGVPDDLEVVVSGGDHSYSKTDRNSGVRKAEVSRDRRWMAEYVDDENVAQGSSLTDVFWIDDGRY
jgi:hypothetical protein